MTNKEIAEKIAREYVPPMNPNRVKFELIDSIQQALDVKDAEVRGRIEGFINSYFEKLVDPDTNPYERYINDRICKALKELKKELFGEGK
jgi:hypothetical protein